jgi:hypothetical protein
MANFGTGAKRPLLQGNVFAGTGAPNPPTDPSGMTHVPQESQGFGIPTGMPKPCGQILIESSRWTREFFDRPSLIVPDTDDPLMHAYCYECNSFQNYNWTANQAYKAKDCRRGGCIYIHRPGWYTFQNVGLWHAPGTPGPIDLKCRVYDEASLWNWSAEMQQNVGYDHHEVAWRTIGATQESPASMWTANRGGADLFPAAVSGYVVMVDNSSGGTQIVASGSTRKWCVIQNIGPTNVDMSFDNATPAAAGAGFRLAASGAGVMQIDGNTPYVGNLQGISDAVSGMVFVTVGM